MVHPVVPAQEFKASLGQHSEIPPQKKRTKLTFPESCRCLASILLGTGIFFLFPLGRERGLWSDKMRTYCVSLCMLPLPTVKPLVGPTSGIFQMALSTTNTDWCTPPLPPPRPGSLRGGGQSPGLQELVLRGTWCPHLLHTRAFLLGTWGMNSHPQPRLPICPLIWKSQRTRGNFPTSPWEGDLRWMQRCF